MSIVHIERPVFGWRHLDYLLYEPASAMRLIVRARRYSVYLVRQRIHTLISVVAARVRGIPVFYKVNDNTVDQMKLEGKLNYLKKALHILQLFLVSSISQ